MGFLQITSGWNAQSIPGSLHDKVNAMNRDVRYLAFSGSSRCAVPGGAGCIRSSLLAGIDIFILLTTRVSFAKYRQSFMWVSDARKRTTTNADRDYDP